MLVVCSIKDYDKNNADIRELVYRTNYKEGRRIRRILLNKSCRAFT
jgi:hypothetical protein